jgi:hypothetical protein
VIAAVRSAMPSSSMLAQQQKNDYERWLAIVALSNNIAGSPIRYDKTDQSFTIMIKLACAFMALN